MVVIGVPAARRLADGRLRYLAAHLASSLPGPAGTAELIAFGRRLGLAPATLRHAGEAAEHFALVDHRRITEAVAGGAVVLDRRALERLMQAKLADAGAPVRC